MPHTAQSVEPEPTTPRLLVLMATGVVVITGVISGFAVIGEWWLLPVTMLALILATVVVAVAISRALDVGARVEARRPSVVPAEPSAPEVRRSPAATGRLAHGH